MVHKWPRLGACLKQRAVLKVFLVPSCPEWQSQLCNRLEGCQLLSALTPSSQSSLGCPRSFWSSEKELEDCICEVGRNQDAKVHSGQGRCWHTFLVSAVLQRSMGFNCAIPGRVWARLQWVHCDMASRTVRCVSSHLGPPSSSSHSSGLWVFRWAVRLHREKTGVRAGEWAFWLSFAARQRPGEMLVWKPRLMDYKIAEEIFIAAW